jgi:uncharacterized protein
MINREIQKRLVRLSRQMPALTITGPRQSGKTTLCKAIFKDFSYHNLELPSELEFAQNDPAAFMRSIGPRAVIDEVQRVPALLSYIQAAVDGDRSGSLRFVLTGSANLLLMEKISQTLAGRTAVVALLPLSMNELAAHGTVFKNWEEPAFRGMYPRLYDKSIDAPEWLGSYIQTYVERDVRSVLNVRDLSLFRTFLRLCAGRTGQMLNLASLGSDAGIDHKTAQHWLSLLETTYIAWRMPPYHRNFNKRLVKSPKLYFYDTGLLCHLLEIGSAADLRSHYARGAIFENFCLNELRKDNENTGVSLPFYYWRDSGGHEIDCLIERSGALHCVEIKSSSTVNESFFTILEYFRKTANTLKVTSQVIYGGDGQQRRSNATLVSWRHIHEVSTNLMRNDV